MQPIKRQNKADVLDALRRMVLTQELLPVADLDEATLSAQWHLSRTPLRDVLRQLAGEGYVEIRENRGARGSQMSHRNLRVSCLAAPMIYAAILRLAAQIATPAQIETLKQAQEACKALLRGGDIAARALAKTHFHKVTGDMTANTHLLPSFRRLLIDHARISMTPFRPSDTKDAQDLTHASAQHDAIITAIESADGDAAADLAIQHWNLSRHRIEQFVMPAGLDLALGSA